MKEIKLSRGYVTKIDDEDFDFVSKYKWYARVHNDRKNLVYAITHDKQKRNGSKISLHRLLMGNPVGMWVDHKDHDTLNNQKSNIRVATRFQNQQNRGPNKNNKSGYKGVWWCTRRKKWVAELVAYGKKHHIGVFTDKEIAHKEHVKKSRLLHKDFSGV